MYFDVTAMALAWLLSGEAQSMAIRRRFASMVEQLAPLNPPPHSLAAPAADLDDPHARWLSGVILGFSFAALIWQTHTGTIANGLLTALAVAAAGCPCTLGIVRSSAWVDSSERALALGWLIPEGAAWSRLASVPEADRLALKLGAADESALFSLARAVRRTIRWNYLWSIGFNVVLLPLALFGPVPALLPAITMLLARLLIWLTTRRLGMGCPLAVQSR
jgi:cation transport ATPase